MEGGDELDVPDISPDDGEERRFRVVTEQSHHPLVLTNVQMTVLIVEFANQLVQLRRKPEM